LAPRPPAKAGAERRSARRGWGLALLALAAAVGGILVLALWAGRDEFSTHRAYLLGDDGARVSIDYAALSPALDEAALQRLLAPAVWRCSDTEGGAARLCEAALAQANGVAAARLRATLRQGQLQQTEVFVPWWAHHAAARALTAQLGAPSAYDAQPSASAQAPSLRWTFAEGALHLPLAPGWNPWRWSVLRWTAGAER
jgi:hypothetical protein